MVDDLAPYLRSLERLRSETFDRMYPGHGPEIEDPATVIDWYVAHRLQRESEIIAAVDAGASTVAEIVEAVYAEVDSSLHPLAARSVSAHLRKLADESRMGFDAVAGRVEPI